MLMLEGDQNGCAMVEAWVVSSALSTTARPATNQGVGLAAQDPMLEKYEDQLSGTEATWLALGR
jgi:hypothetical protein